MEQSIEDLRIIPSGGGVFEVIVDGDLVYSKKNTGRHAESGEVEAIIRSRA
jgi:selenoprotein W-related protein